MKRQSKYKKQYSKSKNRYGLEKEKAEQYPHFRRYKKSQNHPALITREYSPEEYEYRKVMHAERDGRHLNERVSPNPNPQDPRPMHIAKRKRHDNKKYFSKNKLPWKYPPSRQ